MRTEEMPNKMQIIYCYETQIFMRIVALEYDKSIIIKAIRYQPLLRTTAEHSK